MIKNSFKTIKGQMLSGFSILVILLLFYFFVNHEYRNEENKLRNIQLSISKSINDMLSIRRNEKDFIERMEYKYIEQLNISKKSLNNIIQKIESDLNNGGFEKNISFPDIYLAIGKYESKFNEFIKLKKTLHSEYDNKDNLLRINKDFSTKLTMDLLKLKKTSILLNFINTSYKINKFLLYPSIKSKKEAILEINKLVNNAKNDDNIIYHEIINYNNNFNNIINIYEKIGFNHQFGLHLELRKTMHVIEDKLNLLQQKTPIKIKNRLDKIEKNLHLLALLTLVSICLILIYIYRKISKLEKDILISKSNAIKANIEKSTFLANMSHEIRTPLNGIIGMSEILSSTDLNINQKEYLSILNSSSHSLLALINDILDLSKIESGKLEINNHSANIRTIIYDSISLSLNKIQEKQLSLEVIIPSNIPDTVYIDEQRLKQILINLISNAIKFTEEGKITVQVTTFDIHKKTENIYISIKDTGIGIDQENLKNIFNPFVQADNTITRKFGGTGLGLNICKLLIDKMDGILDVESKKGIGTIFSFKLPMKIIRLKPKLKKELSKCNIVYRIETDYVKNLLVNELDFYRIEPKEFDNDFGLNIFIYEHINDNLTRNVIGEMRESIDNIKVIIIYDISNPPDNIYELADSISAYPIFGDKMIEEIISLTSKKSISNNESDTLKVDGKILVVEDNIVNQKVVKLHLEKEGYIIDIAENGLQALNKIKNGNSYDIILMDCMMPEMDGFTATIKIREYENEYHKKRTPIIALTASVIEKDIQKCLDSGMDKYLSKPLKREILYSTIADVISSNKKLS